MSDETKTKAGDDTGTGKTEPQNKPDSGPEPGTEKKADDSSALSKLEAQVKELTKRASEAEKKADELEKEKLKKSGDLEGLLKKEREQSTKLADELKKVKIKTLKASLNTQILKHAPDAHNADLVAKLPEVKDTVEMDADTLSISKVEDAISKARKAHPYLFKNQNGPIGPTRLPNQNRGNMGDEGDAKAFQQKMLAAKTQQERVIIRRAFGREL